MTVCGSSPASTGPAGSHFEGQVGAYYLLSMLTGAEPRGLPGTIIERIELQRAAEGRALDDVIVKAHDLQGNSAVLEVQVKRSISFTPKDTVFRDVVNQIVKASRRADFWTIRYELAIATARTSWKMSGPYQDVLTWARQIDDAATFLARIERPGSANDAMRTFVNTFRTHLKVAGATDDDVSVWRLLRKLQILTFDFSAQGSQSEALAKERAVRALHSEDVARAGDFWNALVGLAIKIAASGGDRNRDRLIEDLRSQSFRLAGDLRYATVRRALAEASSLALADISDRVGEVILTRHERVAAVHAGLDNGRYLEIRGNSGVGKSGILKHVAGQISTEAPVIVLSPWRTIPNGWMAMRGALGFDGTARDLLTDLSGDGAAVLFIDNLDFFGEEERKTVIDLVREASIVPGFSVIATARLKFGVDEPSWLPADALDRLGRTEPLIIDELSETEVEELRHYAPKLAPLLADNHPARGVSRNLYRLARLANQPGDSPVQRTEVDMAELWWKTADGKIDDGHRERARVLKTIAERALASIGPVDVSDLPPKAVDALVVSETLRDLGNDRLVFRHDVLREWGIANLVYLDLSILERNPLERPAPEALARGVELTARMFLERSQDTREWQMLLERLSREGVHGSWRRAALLAIVRSEIGIDLLTKASGILLADKAKILSELIRIMLAVEVKTAEKLLAAIGMAPENISTGINIPSGSSWLRLIGWLYSLGERLPAAALPDVVDLYTNWLFGTLGLTPLTPALLKCIYDWLTEIEEAREDTDMHTRRVLFGGEIDGESIKSLATDLRNCFLLLCHNVPELAAEYLRALGRRQHNDNAVRSIFELSRGLAQAAPAELAELTAALLIPDHRPEGRTRRRDLTGPFGHRDIEFYPASPSKGPFLNLLTHSPAHGLSLIHRLVDHEVLFYSGGKEHGTNAIVIPFPEGERGFPWAQSYLWSRGGADSNIVTSALMALEAWAHQRVEADEPFNIVLCDVLGPAGSPTAYLLVAVDLLLSHWPKSREAAVPFLASPELLCIDRERQVQDSMDFPDGFGLKKEPSVGAVSRESLKKRLSRGMMLDQLLSKYAVFVPQDLRESLVVLLRRAKERLGQPEAQSDLGDPAFMVVHALNLVDPNNWREASVQFADGTEEKGYEYVQPEDERQHMESLQKASSERLSSNNIQLYISAVVGTPSRSSSSFASAAVEWALGAQQIPDEEDKEKDRMRNHAIIGAAMIAMRDGDAELISKHMDWARGVFMRALEAEGDPVHRFQAGIQYNPFAIAFAGMIYLFKHHAGDENLQTILRAASNKEPAAAHGFNVAATVLESIDERLPRAVLRCAFTASIRPARRWDIEEEEVSTRIDEYQKRVEAAVYAELEWLAGRVPEPRWPSFPPYERRLRRGIRLYKKEMFTESIHQSTPPDIYIDHQAAALWISSMGSLVDVEMRPWIRDIVRRYGTWTSEANGAGMREYEEVENRPREWNDAYFNLLAFCLPGLSLAEVEVLALSTINALPDEAFYDAISQFLLSVDMLYFRDFKIQESIALSIRSSIADHMVKTLGWVRHTERRSDRVEIHIGPAIATLFFNEYIFAGPARCYLNSNGINRLDCFLPILERLILRGSSIFVAFVALNLLEVSPRPGHLSFIVTAAKAWIDSYPNDKGFWVDYAIGIRVCALIDNIRNQQPELLRAGEGIRADVDRLIAALVNLGIADGRRLEEALGT